MNSYRLLMWKCVCYMILRSTMPSVLSFSVVRNAQFRSGSNRIATTTAALVQQLQQQQQRRLGVIVLHDSNNNKNPDNDGDDDDIEGAAGNIGGDGKNLHAHGNTNNNQNSLQNFVLQNFYNDINDLKAKSTTKDDIAAMTNAIKADIAAMANANKADIAAVTTNVANLTTNVAAMANANKNDIAARLTSLI
jgi:hypothetical protein